MKIGIVSLYGWLKLWDNYGSLLQNYALQVRLKQWGHETYWIRTRVDPSASAPSPTEGFWPSLRALARWGLRITGWRSKGDKQREFDRNHPRRFAPFFATHVPHTDREYTVDELLDNPPNADAYIVGSDQVWRDPTPLNLLAFGPQSVKRVAYAVSAPWTALSPEWYATAAPEVKRLQAISVRELEGLRVCSEMGRSDAVQTVDPTLLLDRDDYRSLIRAEEDDLPFEQPLALAYFVNVLRRRDVPWTALRAFAANNGMDLRVVPLQGSELIFPSKYVYTPSPTEWLNAFDKAECVVTNSYHGTLFALIMRRPFLALLQGGPTSAQNSRFFSILEPLGLSERIVSRREADVASVRDVERRMFTEIDWTDVEARLAGLRERSETFLLDSLA